ncbi:MAG: phosphodiester glycosidase family protein [Clostridia bacterium]|nr:phosphodiester glycosidase family protein [Clostridia bacterium]
MLKRVFALLFCAALLCGCANAEVVPLEPDELAPAPLESGYTSPTHYEDPSITVDTYPGNRIHDTNYIYAVIKVADGSQIRTAMAYKYNSSYTVVGQVMAEANNAVLAINGDYFSFYDYGFLVRQGHQYRYRPNYYWDLLIIDQYGDLHAITRPTGDRIQAWIESHPDLAVMNTFNFGPAMIIDGEWTQEVFSDDNLLNYGSISGASHYARVALCQLAPLTYMVVACESMYDEGSAGMTLNEFCDCLREIDEKLEDYDIQVAYNLDGGGSATMVFHNEKIYSLYYPKTRTLSDIIYFASAWREGVN